MGKYLAIALALLLSGCQRRAGIAITVSGLKGLSYKALQVTLRSGNEKPRVLRAFQKDELELSGDSSDKVLLGIEDTQGLAGPVVVEVAAVHAQGIEDKDVWAVGAGGTILYRSAKNKWIVQDVNTKKDLRAVWGFPGGYRWAVGEDGTIAEWKAAVGRWITVPPELSGLRLQAVTGGEKGWQGWAVGCKNPKASPQAWIKARTIQGTWEDLNLPPADQTGCFVNVWYGGGRLWLSGVLSLLSYDVENKVWGDPGKQSPPSGGNCVGWRSELVCPDAYDGLAFGPGDPWFRFDFGAQTGRAAGGSFFRVPDAIYNDRLHDDLFYYGDGIVHCKEKGVACAKSRLLPK